MKEQIEQIWKDETAAAYELTSVFIHRGSSPSWGHYFFYSRNLPEQPDSWFKYNDSDVSKVPKEEVLADTTGSTANPYMVSPFQKGHGHAVLMCGVWDSWYLCVRAATRSIPSIGSTRTCWRMQRDMRGCFVVVVNVPSPLGLLSLLLVPVSCSLLAAFCYLAPSPTIRHRIRIVLHAHPGHSYQYNVSLHRHHNIIAAAFLVTKPSRCLIASY